MQTYGGHGYIRENGVEQLVRDARITQLYEGTNGIQALDLVGRKLPMKGGRRRSACSAEMSGFVAANKADDKMKEFVEPLEKALGRVAGRRAVPDAERHEEPRRGGRRGDRPAAPDGAHRDGLHVGAHRIAAHKGLAAGNDNAFYEAKLDTARFYMARVLPQTTSLNHQIKAGAATLMAMPAEAF